MDTQSNTYGEPLAAGIDALLRLLAPGLSAANTHPPTPTQEAVQSTNTSANGLLAFLATIVNQNMSVRQADSKAESDETVTNLRIKNAVLENDLKHAQRENDGLVTGLTTVIGLMSHNRNTNYVSPAATVNLPVVAATTKDLEKEIERLRRETRSLRSRLRESGSAAVKVEVQDRKPLQDSPPAVTETQVKLEEGINCIPHVHRAEDKEISAPTPSELAGSWAAQQELLLSDSFGFDAEPEDGANHNPTTSQSMTGHLMLSLEDFLYGDESTDDPCSKLNKLTDAVLDNPFKHETDFDLDEDRPFDDKIAQSRAMDSFYSLSKPGVLKTGGTAKDSVRGDLTLRSEVKKTGSPAPLNTATGPRVCPWVDPTQEQQNRPFYRPGHKRNRGRDLGAERAHFNTYLDESQTIGPDAIWNSFAERAQALDDETRFPDIFNHGIQYRPGGSDKNYFRTIHIEGLPRNIVLRDVLARVRGGEILSATLLDTKSLLNTMSARVVFKNEDAAREFVVWAGAHPITFPSEDDDIHEAATVTLVSTPTYPPSLRDQQKIPYATRCIAVSKFPSHIRLGIVEWEILCVRMQVGVHEPEFRKDSLLEHYLDSNGTLHMEFSNLDISASAWKTLEFARVFKEYRLQISYERDPCAGPLEELFEDVKPRPRMLPVGHVYTELPKPRTLFSFADERARMDEHRPKIIDEKVIAIPSFSGAGISANSWADEVEDELEAQNQAALGTSQSLAVETTLTDFNVAILPIFAPIDEVISKSINSLASNSSNHDMAGLAGSKYAPRANKSRVRIESQVRFSPSPSFTPTQSTTSSIEQKPLKAKAIHFLSTAPPESNLQYLIGSDSSESSSEGDMSTQEQAGRFLSNAPSESNLEDLIGEVSSESESGEDEIETSQHTTPGSYSGSEQALDEANLAIPVRELQAMVDSLSPEQNETSLAVLKPVAAGGIREAVDTVIGARVRGMKLENANPRYRATNMDGGVKNPDEIDLDSDDDD